MSEDKQTPDGPENSPWTAGNGKAKGTPPEAPRGDGIGFLLRPALLILASFGIATLAWWWMERENITLPAAGDSPQATEIAEDPGTPPARSSQTETPPGTPADDPSPAASPAQGEPGVAEATDAELAALSARVEQLSARLDQFINSTGQDGTGGQAPAATAGLRERIAALEAEAVSGTVNLSNDMRALEARVRTMEQRLARLTGADARGAADAHFAALALLRRLETGKAYEAELSILERAIRPLDTDMQAAIRARMDDLRDSAATGLPSLAALEEALVRGAGLPLDTGADADGETGFWSAIGKGLSGLVRVRRVDEEGAPSREIEEARALVARGEVQAAMDRLSGLAEGNAAVQEFRALARARLAGLAAGRAILQDSLAGGGQTP